MIFEHCLAPDTTSGAGIGCDNMTIMIVAITHGRTKEEWYQWITDRVKKGYGYQTPSTVPQLYSQSRLLSFRARREAQEARERQRASEPEPPSAFDNDDFLRRYGLTVTTIASNGISYGPGSGVANDSGQLMFGNDDSEEEDSEEEPVGGRSFFTESLGLGRSESPDATRNLRARLDEFEQDIQKENEETDADGDSTMHEAESGKGELDLFYLLPLIFRPFCRLSVTTHNETT